eukprot:CAMPEP_0172620184 /NCGR_PEP_ID=MMETSP1068-20121228/101100_1 /TAXON_ID=35684 /ORGANISM="Pseudopedinella elastica, Strain CCMP716" /LENGTH=59 /DNA_ID=CAMNT_0013427335 /DNA_START=1 /DNA_END=177 /DNA_ORIENTATION=+
MQRPVVPRALLSHPGSRQRLPPSMRSAAACRAPCTLIASLLSATLTSAVRYAAACRAPC